MPSEAVKVAAKNVAEAFLALVEGARARRARATKAELAKLQKVLRSRWRAQRRALLTATAGLAVLFAERPEGGTTTQRAKAVVAPVIAAAWDDSDSSDVPEKQSDDWTAALLTAFGIGASLVAKELGEREAPTEKAVEQFGAGRAVFKPADGIDRTTQERITNAVAEVYEAGGDLEEARQVIAETFGSFLDSRMLTVSAFELNAAYNAGRLAEAKELGIDSKWWNPDGPCCDVCQENADAGEIPVDDEFPSGDMAPGAHPNCDCVLMAGGTD